MHSLNKVIAYYLEELAAKFRADNSNVTEEQAIDILRVVAHEEVSKEGSCDFLNLSRSRFDEKIKLKKIPKGRKEKGWKELRWYKDELELCKNRK